MPQFTIPHTAHGWPYLDDANYVAATPDYTLELADKLENADADVAAAINAAQDAQDARDAAQAAQAAAEAAAEVDDTGQLSLTLGGSWTGWYRVRAGIVYVWASYVASTPNGTTRSVASGLPTNCQPSHDTPLASFAVSMSAGVVSRIKSDGTIEILNQTGYAKNPITAYGSWPQP